MDETPQLVRQAGELGERIARHPRVQAYLAAQRAVRADSSAQQLLRDYTQQMDHLQRLEMERKPIEVADKRKAADLEARISSNDLLKQLMRAQADYVELMNQVNGALGAPLAQAAGPATGS